jgi:hypothetical protein
VSTAEPDLTIMVVGSDGALIFESLESLLWQSVSCARVVVTTSSGLRRALDSVQTEWASILPQGAQLDPQWLFRVGELLGKVDLGAVGGRTLVIWGARTYSCWFDAPASATSMDVFGRVRSLLEDLPSRPMSSPAFFLRWDNMVCRTVVVRESLDVEDDVTRALHATRPCALAIRRGLEVVYDSEMRCARHMRRGADPMSPQPQPEEWRRMASQQIFELANLPLGALAARAALFSALVGTRQSPGLLLGVMYAWWPRRRQRWWAFTRGKLSGLLRVLKCLAR